MRLWILAAAVCGIAVGPAFAEPPSSKPVADQSVAIADKLLEPFEIAQRITKMPLKDVLELIEKKAGVTVLIDHKALFAAQGGQAALPRPRNDIVLAVNRAADDVLFDPEVMENKAITLPSMKKVRLETVLRMVADQINADYYIAPDHVQLTTSSVKDLVTGAAKPLPSLTRSDSGAEDSQIERSVIVRQIPYVTASFIALPATEAFKQIAARAGRTVVVSAPAAAKAENPVTISLSNVAFETAAAGIAEAAGLRAFRNGNVVVIVTPERAKEIENPETPLRVGVGGLAGIGGGSGMMTLDDLETIARVFNGKNAKKAKK